MVKVNLNKVDAARHLLPKTREGVAQRFAGEFDGECLVSNPSIELKSIWICSRKHEEMMIM